MTTTCPKCGDPLLRELPNSLLCFDCYRAAICGVTVEQVRARDAATRAEIERLQNERAA